MSKIGVSIRIVTPLNEIERMANKAIRDELNKGLGKVAQLVEQDFRRIKSIFIKTDVYESLTQGPLDAHFGIPKGEAFDRLDAIIDTLIGSVQVRPVRVAVRAGKLTGGIVIKAFRADFEDILGLPESRVEYTKQTEPDKGEPVTLEWLDWLLIRGDEIIIEEHEISFGNHPRSRSGKAVMVKNETSVWRVPTGVSGTIRKNWITKAVEDSRKFIEQFLSNSIQKNIDKVF